MSEDDQSGEDEGSLNPGQAADGAKGNKESGKRKRKNKTANVLGVRYVYLRTSQHRTAFVHTERTTFLFLISLRY